MATGSATPLRSLKRRLTLGIVVTAAVALFAEALLLHVVWYGYEERLIDRVVLDELRRSQAIHQREPALAYPNTGDLRLFVVRRDAAEPGDPLPPHFLPLRDVEVAAGDVTIREVTGADGVDYHVGIARSGDTTYLLAYDARDHTERRTALLWAVTAIAAVLTFIASRVSLRLVDRLLAGMSRLQRRIADHSQGGFLDDDMDVEVAALAAALDDQRQQVAAALRKERAFAAAASHELRTPLTRIATGADVLLAQPSLPGSIATRLRSIRESVDELQRLLDVLLQVARWQPGHGEALSIAASGPARPLGEVVARCVDRLAAEANLLGTSVTVALETPHRPIDHPAMLDIVLSNLLRNAIRHGRSAPVEVHGRESLLEVVDAGPGIEAAALDRIFDPFWRAAPSDESGPSGMGLGLTIAERVCAAAGWRLSVSSSAGQGTRATVRLDATGAPA